MSHHLGVAFSVAAEPSLPVFVDDDDGLTRRNVGS